MTGFNRGDLAQVSEMGWIWRFLSWRCRRRSSLLWFWEVLRSYPGKPRFQTDRQLAPVPENLIEQGFSVNVCGEGNPNAVFTMKRQAVWPVGEEADDFSDMERP